MKNNFEISNWRKEFESFIQAHNIPKDETLLLRQANENHEIYLFATYNKKLNEYYLYKIKNGKAKKSKTSDTLDFKELEV